MLTSLKTTVITSANANDNPIFASAFAQFNNATPDFQSAYATPATGDNWETFSEPGDAIAAVLHNSDQYAFAAIGAYLTSGLTVYLFHTGTFL